jgi:hypothetical protein
MSRQIIEIANPLPGGQSFTSLKRAQEYCRKGVAYKLKDGRLRFRAQTQSRREASDVYIRGMVFWNGRNPGHMHRPGEVVS